MTAPGLNPNTTPALVTGDYQATSNPESLGEALWHGGVPCGANGYLVVTKRINTTA